LSDRLYGDDSYGAGTYGGPLPTWDQLGAIQGPIGDSDLAYLAPVRGDLTYTSGWQPYPAYQQPYVYRDRQGVCSLSGVFQGPTSFAAGVVVAYLPAGFWPLNRVMHLVATGDPMNFSRLDINTDGGLSIGSNPAAGVSYCYMDMVWFSCLPSTYTIQGCAATVLYAGPGSQAGTYQLSCAAGKIFGANGIENIRAQTVLVDAVTPVNTWGIVYIMNGGLYVTMGNATSETSLIQWYYQRCSAGSGDLNYPSMAILATVQFANPPVVHDQRWFPFQAPAQGA
jgi:hypothetical protein